MREITEDPRVTGSPVTLRRILVVLRVRNRLRGMVPTPETASPDLETDQTLDAESALEPLYHLILMDDNDHTYPYVVEMLGRIFGYGKEKSFTLATIVDHAGQAILETVSREMALRHQRLIHAYGADPRIERSQGSMSAILEQAP